MNKEILKDLKYSILDNINHLTIYDYFAYSWVVVIFLLLLFIIFMTIKKKPKFALSLFIFNLVFLIASPLIIKFYFDKSIKNVIITHNTKKLDFSHMLVIDGKLKSKAKIDFEKCRVYAIVIEKTNNKYKKLLNYLKFNRYSSIVIDKQLKKGEILPYKIVFKDFHQEDYETKVYGECY